MKKGKNRFTREKILPGILDTGDGTFFRMHDKIQSLSYKTQEYVKKIFMGKYKRYSEYLEKMLGKELPISVDDVHISDFKKFDRAHYYGVTERETPLQKKISVFEYTGEIEVSAGGKPLTQKFTYSISMPLEDCGLQRHERSMHRITCDNGLTIPLSQAEAFGSESKDRVIQICQHIVKTIEENYGYDKELLKDEFRRGNAQVKNLPTLREKKQYEERLYEELVSNNEIDLSFFYQDEGAKIYRDMTKTGEYTSFIDNEQVIIDENIQDFIDSIISQNKKLVDLGCGEGEKIITLTKRGEIKDCEYIGTDMSVSNLFWLANTKNNIHSNFFGIFSFLAQDFDDLSILREQRDKTIFVLGGSLGNIAKENDKQLKFLQNIASVLHEGEKCVFSAFLLPPDVEKLKESYKYSKVQAWFMHGLKKLGFDTESLGYEVEYEDNAIQIYAVCKEDQNTLSIGGRKFTKKAGERICLARSQRFAEEEILELITQAGLKLEKKCTTGDSGMYVVSK